MVAIFEQRIVHYFITRNTKTEIIKLNVNHKLFMVYIERVGKLPTIGSFAAVRRLCDSQTI